jgi:2-oxoglutarate ferredoxin oxidoreductase subunit alpha
LTQEELDALEEPYLRYRVTQSGVSPRAVPGHPNAVYVSTANEHDERGAVNEEPDNRAAQAEKRMRKMEGMVQEVEGPSWYGPEEAELTFICWGSTYGPLREAVDRLNADRPGPSTLRRGSGRASLRTGRANMLHFSELHPFPLEATEAALERTKRTIMVEGNATGQLETLLRARTGRSVDGAIHKYDGRAFTPGYIVARVSKEV